MDFDILDIIEDATKEADAFEGHPAADFSMEEQILYLNGLALVMNADGHIDDSEKEYIRILIKSIGMDESTLDDMVNFAKAPDKDTIQAFFRTFRRRPIAQLFLFDALMMTRRDGKVEEKEVAVVNKIADQLEILKGTQQDIFDLFCHIKNRNWQESALYFSSHLLNPEHFKHLLAYHEVSFDDLMEETKGIRRSRLLEVLKNKMPKAESGENVKPKLDADIVLPMLQAEIDRGNALVINNQLSLKDSESFGELDLDSIGFQWDKETLSLSCKQNIFISSGKVIEKFIFIMEVEKSASFIELLYRGGFDSEPLGLVDENNKNRLNLSCSISKTESYMQYDDNIFLVTGKGSYSDRAYLSTLYTLGGWGSRNHYSLVYDDTTNQMISVGDLSIVDLEYIFNKGLPVSND